ncbi:unnamed protein product [Protopolystoma xenopodis]|uniref:Uncharacterized protein n=1 Tax=Protopolystoma xenopodis TaxID=117903 RepID=A0A3S5AA40_9PLAT|nr:unnamed protein product [Protopolystoma xenopodis]
MSTAGNVEDLMNGDLPSSVPISAQPLLRPLCEKTRLPCKSSWLVAGLGGIIGRGDLSRPESVSRSKGLGKPDLRSGLNMSESSSVCHLRGFWLPERRLES